MAMPMARQTETSTVQGDQDAKMHAADAEDTMTPKGTLLILFLYAGVLTALWGYTYITMLLRR